MPLRTGEAYILRTYALKESDKIVSFFTREWGKCRGVARGARRPKSRFGASLEPLSRVQVQFFERENRELVALDHCELLDSMWAGVASEGSDLLQSVSVSVMVEVAERMLPDREINDAAYRLLGAVVPAMPPGGSPWLPLTYYLYWMVRLGGFLPPWSRGASGPELGPEALALAGALQRRPVSGLADCADAAAAAEGRELRRVLRWCIEDHLEAGLRSWSLLASLEPTGGGAGA